MEAVGDTSTENYGHLQFSFFHNEPMLKMFTAGGTEREWTVREAVHPLNHGKAVLCGFKIVL